MTTGDWFTLAYFGFGLALHCLVQDCDSAVEDPWPMQWSRRPVPITHRIAVIVAWPAVIATVLLYFAVERYNRICEKGRVRQ